MRKLVTALLLCAAPALADPPNVDVYVLGEVHDNPAHHLRQAEIVGQVAPRAIVFEMLSPAQVAAAATADVQNPAELGEAFDWESGGWPPFAEYLPIFEAAPDAVIYGAALPRAEVRRAISDGAAAVFGDDAAAYGLIDLPAEIFDEMIEEQRLAHCDMLPPEMLPGMVQAQILRDAVFARTILEALEQTGGPVVMITGNGHARRDRAIPAILGRVAPAVSVWALGQFEGPPDPDEPFDATAISPFVPRDDPCLVFTNGQW